MTFNSSNMITTMTTMILLITVTLGTAFSVSSLPLTNKFAADSGSISSSSLVLLHMSSDNISDKGFESGSSKKKRGNTIKPKSVGQIQREKASTKYDEIAATGGQEYNIFVRQFGSDDESWLPCGSIAVPRTLQVSQAIFENELALQQSIVRTFPKLKGSELEFEYGYNLKIYPDDPVEVAKKMKPKDQSAFSIGNWMSTLLSPIDASGQQGGGK